MNYKVRDCCYFASVLWRIHIKILFLIGHMFTYSIKMTWKGKFRADITQYFLFEKWRIRILRVKSSPFQIICSQWKSEKRKNTTDTGHAVPINLESWIYGWAYLLLLLLISGKTENLLLFQLTDRWRNWDGVTCRCVMLGELPQAFEPKSSFLYHRLHSLLEMMCIALRV